MKRPSVKSFQDLILTKDLGYIETRMLISQLEEVNKLLDSYSDSILASGFWLLSSDFSLLVV